MPCRVLMARLLGLTVGGVEPGLVAPIYKGIDHPELLDGHVLGCLNPCELLFHISLLLLHRHNVFLEVGYVRGGLDVASLAALLAVLFPWDAC